MQRIKWFDSPADNSDYLEFLKWKEYCNPTDTWSTLPFRYDKDGPLIIPPRLPFSKYTEEYSSSDFDSSDNEKPEFSLLKQRKLRSLVTGLRDRQTINRAMCFCIRYGNSASEIIDILTSSIIMDQDYDQRILRIYLLNDILFNSKSRYPDAWRYRSVIENNLGEMFEYFSKLHSTITGRLKADQWRRFVLGLLNVWQTWDIYHEEFIQGLRDTFNQKKVTGLQAVKELESKVDSMDNLESKFKPISQATTTLQAVKELESKVDSMDNLESKFKPISQATTTLQAVKELESKVDSMDNLESKFKPISQATITPQAVKKPLKIGFQLKKTKKVMPMMKNTFKPVDSVDLDSVIPETVPEPKLQPVAIEIRKFEGMFNKSLIDVDVEIDPDLDGMPIDEEFIPPPPSIPHPSMINVTESTFIPPPSIPHPSMINVTESTFIPPPPSTPHPSVVNVADPKFIPPPPSTPHPSTVSDIQKHKLSIEKPPPPKKPHPSMIKNSHRFSTPAIARSTENPNVKTTKSIITEPDDDEIEDIFA
ncbi:hypothetical protein HDV06_000832 [Boothiomyces sp. JEL0866]|nr:hypothetical protein HDV06_000832 [Boothiomyces sp. JEL0866]